MSEKKTTPEELTAAEAQTPEGETEAQAAEEAGYDGDELVSIRLFKDGERYKNDVFVAVNGQSVLIQRGVRVDVKRKFADVLEQSLDQDQRTAGLIERESKAYQEASTKLD